MSLASGFTLGPYTIQSQLGKGGMGEVYLAADNRLERNVAIKVLPERFLTHREALKRFEREAKVLASLSHPNILTIYDVGTQDSISYVVMELLKGETLRTRLQRSALSIPEVLELATQMAEGLEAAHANRVIHRDLKPENIFLTPNGQLKILDFGLARVALAPQEQIGDAPTKSFDTEAGTILGTAPYMSPEQLRGEEVDARTDIFSFGVILYEMITHRRPFGGHTASEIVAAILKDQPDRTSKIRNDVPSPLDELVANCLEKDPQQRIQSATDLRAALTRLGSRNKTIIVSQGSNRKVYRNVGAIAVIVLLAVLSYFVTQRTPDIASLAVLPFHNVSGDPDSEYLSEGITETLINNMSKISGLRVIARTTAFTYKNQEVNPTEIGKKLRVEAILTGKIVHRKEDLTVQADLIETSKGSQLWGNRYTSKLSDLLTVEQKIAKEITQSLKIKLSGKEEQRVYERPTENNEAYNLYLKGRYQWNKRTDEGLRQALTYFQRAIDYDPTFARAYAGLADVYDSFFDYELLRPEEATKKARAAALKALEIDPDLAEAHSSLGHAYLHEWKWSEAENAFERAVELDPNYATTYHWYALCLTSIGKTDQAIEAMKKAQELDPLSLRISADLGMALFAGGKFDESIEQERRTLEMDPKFRVAYWIRGMALEGKGDYPAAIEQFKQALNLSPNNPNYLAAIGHAYGISGKKQEALAVLKQLETIQKEQGGTFPFFLALVHTGIGDNDAAIRMLDQAIAERSGSVRYLTVEPRLEPLRSDPRYAALIEKVGLPH